MAAAAAGDAHGDTVRPLPSRGVGPSAFGRLSLPTHAARHQCTSQVTAAAEGAVDTGHGRALLYTVRYLYMYMVLISARDVSAIKSSIPDFPRHRFCA